MIEAVVGFARTLRSAGLPVTTDRMLSMMSALDQLGVEDIYWAGRLTLCAGPDDIRRFDQVFAAYFLGDRPPVRPVPRSTVAVGSAARPAADSAATDDVRAGALNASDREVLRHRDVTRLTLAERDQVRRLLAVLNPVGPLRRSRRFARARRGPVDEHRTVRQLLRGGGEPARLLHHRHRHRPRRLVFLLDVSGSMAPYADALLRFAHVAVRRRTGTEVFTIGTRLTRISRELRRRDADLALSAVARTVPDWSGGTRLGELLRAFLDRWGQRGTARGAVVVVASDGWERGDPQVLGEQMARLHRLAHRVVWVNPHRGKPGFAPLAAGLVAALPHVDDFVSGHSLAAYEELAIVLSTDPA
ncbi:MAG TPA: VWA domain-containing protein [Actinoplanes sp.]|nr:VWA domain-containing protein [Actinoplanes sp.]